MKGVDSRWQKEEKSQAEDIGQAQQEQEQKALLCLPWRDKVRSSHSGGAGLALPEGWNRKTDHWDSSFLVPCLSARPPLVSKHPADF